MADSEKGEKPEPKPEGQGRAQGGRSRGRARGRARGQQQAANAQVGAHAQGQATGGAAQAQSQAQASQQQQAPPQQAPQAQAPPRQPGAPQSAAAAAEQARTVAAVPSGRASHRGGAKGEPRPGMEAVTRQMGDLQMGGERRRRVLKIGDLYIEPYTRPDHVTDKSGQYGNPVHLKSNYFTLDMAPNYMLYQYSVDYAPEIMNKRLRIALLNEHKDSLIGHVKAFDGGQLFLPRRLPKDPTEVYSTMKNGERVRLTIKLRAEVAPNSDTALQVYNIIFKRILTMIGCQQIQRHYYAPDMCVKIDKHKMEVWPGYVTAIAKFEEKVMLMSDISHKILRSDSVLDTLREIYNKERGGFHEAAKKKLVGQIVLTKYNNKTYRIDDIDFNQNPRSKFKTTSRKFRTNQAAAGEPQETEISYAEYYAKQHEVTLRDMNQPLLMSLPKKADIRRGQQGSFYLIPEQCALTGLTDEVFNDFSIMKDLAVHTRVGPDGRFNTLKKFIDKINSQEDVQKELKGWDLRFASQLVDVPARWHPAEQILQGQHKYSYDRNKADWDRELRGKNLHQSIPLNDWLFLYNGRRDEANANNFVQALLRVGKGMGFNIGQPRHLQVDGQTAGFVRALRENLNPRVQMVVCMLPTNKKDTYDSIKKICCTEMPVPSQCLIAKTVFKKERVMSVATKIAIQMNMKLGGQAWTVDLPLDGMMICGIDTYHDSAKKGRSVCALVCSMNKAATRYFSTTTFQHSQEELAHGLTVNFVAALKQFHAINGGRLPLRVMVYRDGVGDGQLDQVLKYELPQIKAAFKQLGTDYEPKFGFVVVKKRINTRLFHSQRGLITNPPPGVVVDKVVTRPEAYDFFLVSQSVRQGSVTPTHYNVIYDTMGLKPDHYQRLTYKLCHLYFNWPGTIRVPAPCQYAHKLAFICGQSLHVAPHAQLCDKLFFL